jgi:hypothetical protein
MVKPFDAAARELIELSPSSWLEYLQIPRPASGRVEVIDSDVSTVTAEADKVLWVEGETPWIVHVELQSSRDARLADRLYRYNALLSYRHEDLRPVLLAMSERYRREASPDQEAMLWAATIILMGLRYREERVNEILEGVRDMLFGIRGIEESSVYQGLISRGEAKGRTEEARDNVLRQGRKKLGPPNDQVLAVIASTTDLDRLHDWLDRILDVSSWDELLPPSGSSI